MKALGRLGMRDVEGFMLPLFLSVKGAWTRVQTEVADVERSDLRANTFQLPLHRFCLRVFPHKLAELGVVDIQAEKGPVRKMR